MNKTVLFLSVTLCLIMLTVFANANETSFLITYQELGWHQPESGDEAWERYKDKERFFIMRGRMTKEHIVPTKKGQVYIVKKGEKLPDWDDDLSIGRVMFEPLSDGSGNLGAVKFNALDDKGFCNLGFGIVLPIGSTLETEKTQWMGKQISKGIVKISSTGLEFIAEKSGTKE